MVRESDQQAASVSVIIPAYNAGHCIKLAIESVLSQDLVPEQIIVVDDGSTDHTANVLRAFGSRIKFLRQENQGQAAARNVGILMSKTKYVAFLDADDYWDKCFLQQTVMFLENNLDAVAVLTGWIKIHHDGKREIVPPIMNYPAEVRPNHPIILDNFWKFWAEQWNIQTGAILLRRNVVLKAGLQKEDLRNSQDLEYWGLIATHGKWGFIPEALYVNNSRQASQFNWTGKYKKRRKLSPSVETWQERLITKVPKHADGSFQIIRGRVASGLAHNMMLASRYKDAMHVICCYGNEMPKNLLTCLMNVAAINGIFGIAVASTLLKIRENIKAILLKFGPLGVK